MNCQLDHGVHGRAHHTKTFLPLLIKLLILATKTSAFSWNADPRAAGQSARPVARAPRKILLAGLWDCSSIPAGPTDR
eukprot:2789654-Heterocapsa_arctica.AAC.1